jgi:DNA-binding Xre family transcriptional regulator
MSRPSVPINVKAIRWNMAERGWTSMMLARRAGISQSGMSRIMRLKRAQPETLARISRAFQDSEPVNEGLVGYELLGSESGKEGDIDERVGEGADD